MKIKVFALLVFLNLLAISPCSYGYSEELGAAVSLFKKGEFEEAIKNIEEASLESDEALLIKGYSYIKLKNTDQAIESFERIDQQKFQLSDYVKFKLGEMYFEKGKYSEAAEKFESIFKNHPESSLSERAKIKLSRCLIELKSYDEAIGILKDFVSKNQKSPYLDSAMINLAEAYEKKGRFKDAWRTYHELNLYLPLSPYSKDAIAGFKRLEAKYKFSGFSAPAEALFNKAMAFYSKGDFVSASHIFKQLIDFYPRSNLKDDALVKLGHCEYKRRLYNSSIVHYKQAIKSGGDSAAEAYYYMAFSYGRLGNLWKAIECLEKVAKIYRDSGFADDAMFYIGYYFEVNGFKDRAIVEYQNLLKIYPKSSFADEALWRVGMIYYSRGDYKNAYDCFSRVVSDYESGDYAAKCSFWKAKSASKLGWYDKALDAYKFTIKRYDRTFYSYRAREILKSWNIPFEDREESYNLLAESDEISNPYKGEPPSVDIGSLDLTPISKDESDEIEISESIGTGDVSKNYSRYEMLMGLGLFDEAVEEAKYIVRQSKNETKDAALLALSTALFSSGRFRGALKFAEQKCNEIIKRGEFDNTPSHLWQLAYPRAYFKYIVEAAYEYKVDPYLILAVVREESRFNPRVVSWARAHGLMQIIPKTGMNLARILGISPFDRYKLFDPKTNIRMGTYYLKTLLDRFNGNVYLALAAYNGGPNNVKKWIKKRSPDEDIDEFVEFIPFYETRKYVQKVMKSYKEYIRIYSKG